MKMKLAKHILLQIFNTKCHKDPKSSFGDNTGVQTYLPIIYLCHAVCVKDTAVLSINHICASN
jgi:hypothetical protein